MKLINLLNNFIFKKSILFNILKKIKLFNNILTLNFNLIYSGQNNTLFNYQFLKNLILTEKINLINENNLKILTISNNLTKLVLVNNLFLNFINFDFYNSTISNYNSLLILNIKLKNLITN